VRVKTEIFLGRAAYYAYLVPSSLALLAACVPPGTGSRWNPLVVARSVGGVFASLANFHSAPLIESARRLGSSPGLVGWLAGGLAASWALADYSGWRMNEVFSVFWHDQQPKLRDALKEAREGVHSRQTR
jgi:hypothetical protein